ncbi:uncharacterized protein LOC6546085 [Drosophila erecta]|uniref:Uncharacterized protein n=1 Tax=Drosophila erecta TaxID=7220 RepID=B3NGP1_DROER|nr:uncharacterized protein LOC6546085 [Drosophila erecta]EDV51277.1 uncharacterized protein Dere_GG13992 [Drosophila erecta]
MEEQQFTPEAENCVQKDAVKNARIPRDVKLKLQRHLNKLGYSQQVLLEASTHQNRNYSNAVLQYVATTIGRSEEMVKNCDSVSLNNITQWLELMKSSQLSELCEFEAAAAVNYIIQNETKPSPEELSGIDLNEAYKFVENALMGQPQKTMSDATKAFLSKEIELLIEMANTDESDDVARSMGQRLYDHKSLDYMEQRQKCSLDPLFLDENLT